MRRYTPLFFVNICQQMQNFITIDDFQTRVGKILGRDKVSIHQILSVVTRACLPIIKIDGKLSINKMIADLFLSMVKYKRFKAKGKQRLSVDYGHETLW